MPSVQSASGKLCCTKGWKEGAAQPHIVSQNRRRHCGGGLCALPAPHQVSNGDNGQVLIRTQVDPSPTSALLQIITSSRSVSWDPLTQHLEIRKPARAISSFILYSSERTLREPSHACLTRTVSTSAATTKYVQVTRRLRWGVAE